MTILQDKNICESCVCYPIKCFDIHRHRHHVRISRIFLFHGDFLKNFLKNSPSQKTQQKGNVCCWPQLSTSLKQRKHSTHTLHHTQTKYLNKLCVENRTDDQSNPLLYYEVLFPVFCSWERCREDTIEKGEKKRKEMGMTGFAFNTAEDQMGERQPWPWGKQMHQDVRRTAKLGGKWPTRDSSVPSAPRTRPRTEHSTNRFVE